MTQAITHAHPNAPILAVFENMKFDLIACLDDLPPTVANPDTLAAARSQFLSAFLTVRHALRTLPHQPPASQ